MSFKTGNSVIKAVGFPAVSAGLIWNIRESDGFVAAELPKPEEYDAAGRYSALE